MSLQGPAEGADTPTIISTIQNILGPNNYVDGTTDNANLLISKCVQAEGRYKLLFKGNFSDPEGGTTHQEELTVYIADDGTINPDPKNRPATIFLEDSILLSLKHFKPGTKPN